MRKVHIDTCPICRGTQFSIAVSGKDYFSSGESFKVMACDSCAFLFTQDFPCESDISTYYESEEYISHSDTSRGLINRLYHWVRSYMLANKVKLMARLVVAPTRRLLDIGCGTGYFAGAMKEQGWKVTAIEKNPQARAQATRRCSLDVREAEALFDLPKASFDLITLWHVLEHIEKLNETMAQLHKLLTPEGVLVIALPNADSYDAFHYKEYWAAYDLPRHLWHFRPTTLGILAAKFQFQLHRTYRMPFDVFYIALLSEKYKGQPLQLFRALCVGAAGWFRSQWSINETSSIIYVLKKKK